MWFLFFKVFGFEFLSIANEYIFFESLNFIYFHIAIWLRDTLVSFRGWFGCDVSLRILVCYLVFVFVDNISVGVNVIVHDM